MKLPACNPNLPGAGYRITVRSEGGRTRESLIVAEADDLIRVFEVYDCSRQIDLAAQLDALLASDSRRNEWSYDLFCSMVKFGDIIQMKETFRVEIAKP